MMDDKLQTQVDLMTAKQAANELGVSVPSVHYHIKRGRIGTIRLGHYALLLNGSDVHSLKDERERQRGDRAVAAAG